MAPKGAPKDGADISDLNLAIYELFEKAEGSTPEHVPTEKIEAVAAKLGVEIEQRGIGRLRWIYKVRQEVLKTPLGKEVFKAFVKAGGPRGVTSEEVAAIGKKFGKKLEAGEIHKLRWSLGTRVNRDLFPPQDRPEKPEKPEKAEKPAKPVKAAKPAKEAKPAKPVKAAAKAKPAKAAAAKAKPAKPAKAAKPAKTKGNGSVEVVIEGGGSAVDELLGALDQV